jgi:hypothetical protein
MAKKMKVDFSILTMSFTWSIDHFLACRPRPFTAGLLSHVMVRGS